MYEFFEGLFQNVIDALGIFFAWVGSLLQGFFEAIKSVIITLFKPLIVFFSGLAYLIGKCFYIVVLVVQVIFGIFKVLGGVIAGVFNTFSQLLGFSGSTGYYYMPDAYQQGWNTVVSFMNNTGLNTIAVIMTVFIWVITAYAVIRIAGGEK